MMSIVLLVLATTADAIAKSAGLKVDTYENCALHGTPSSSSIVPLLDFQVQMGGSAEVTGTLTYEATGLYAFDCAFGGGQLVFVWVDDHLVCHTDPPFGNTESSTDGSPQYPLEVDKGTAASIVIHIYSYAEAGPISSAALANVTVRWAALAAPMHAGARPTFVSVPAAALSATSSPLELHRRQLQRELKNGWNLWTYNLLAVARLPESFAISLALCKISSQECLTEVKIEDPLDHGQGSAVRVGPFAADQSYWQLYVAHAGLNVSVSATGGNGTLHLLVEPLGCSSATPAAPASSASTASSASSASSSLGSASASSSSDAALNCSDYALVVSPRFVWFRAGV